MSDVWQDISMQRWAVWPRRCWEWAQQGLHDECLVVLGEAVGKVAGAQRDHGSRAGRTELVQVAAIAHAWHDGLDPIDSMRLGYRRPTQPLPPPGRGGWRLRDLLTAQGHLAAQLGAVSDHCAPARMPGRHAGGGCGCPAMQELRAALLTVAGIAAGWADQLVTT